MSNSHTMHMAAPDESSGLIWFYINVVPQELTVPSQQMSMPNPAPQHQIIHVVHWRRNLRDYFRAKALVIFTSHIQDASFPVYQQAEVHHHYSYKAMIKPTAVSWIFTHWAATQYTEKIKSSGTNSRSTSTPLSHCRLAPSFPRCTECLLFPSGLI